jgi:putative addiction module CopG family antidote
MEATRRLETDVPEDLAGWVEAQVEAGRFANKSEAVTAGLALLQDEEEAANDPQWEAWLRTEVAAAYDEWKANPLGGLTADEVRAFLERERARRRAGA